MRPPSPLWAGLQDGVGELERLLARGGQGVALVCLVLAVYVAAFVSQTTGAVLAGVTSLLLVFYTGVHALLVAGRFTVVLRFLVPLVETTMPAAILWILTRTEGPAYALGSWVPPQLLCVFLAASVLRLDPRLPLAMGGLAAASYGLVWWVAIRGQVDDSTLLHRPDIQVVRMISLVLTGAACSLAVFGLRRAVAEAGRSLRQRDLFGKYRLGAEIAAGGMGRVLEATYCPEGGFQRRVAVKLVHPHLARDPAFVDRFRNEAELAAQLVHPNVVGALDFGRIDDTWFLAMEFVDGRTLEQVCSAHRAAGRLLPPRIVAWIGRELAVALDHAHVRARDPEGRPLRVLHRDLTPSNVMLDRSGRVRLTDFGVARALREAERLHTRTLVGKPSYLAPEVLGDGGVDARADLWSLGVILWEALTGRRLFQRVNDGATLLAVGEAPIPVLAEVRPGLLPHWEPFFGRALARDPARRFDDAAAMADALGAILAAEGTVSPEEIRELARPEDALEELPLDPTEERHDEPDPAVA